MKAKVTYEMHFQPHPWSEKLRSQGVQAWLLCEVIRPEMGPPTFTPVALFNLDS